MKTICVLGHSAPISSRLRTITNLTRKLSLSNSRIIDNQEAKSRNGFGKLSKALFNTQRGQQSNIILWLYTVDEISFTYDIGTSTAARFLEWSINYDF